jgi:hypothetical protein
MRRDIPRLYFWLDDLIRTERPLPDPKRWEGFETSAALIARLEGEIGRTGYDLSHITLDLDHDLGEGTGYDVCLFLVGLSDHSEFRQPRIRIHSTNPLGVTRMVACLDTVGLRVMVKG